MNINDLYTPNKCQCGGKPEQVISIGEKGERIYTIKCWQCESETEPTMIQGEAFLFWENEFTGEDSKEEIADMKKRLDEIEDEIAELENEADDIRSEIRKYEKRQGVAIKKS